LQEAIEEYETALRIQPDYPDARYNLEVALSKARAAKPR
jgi:tetratricopeptide (TPR) repeat protein